MTTLTVVDNQNRSMEGSIRAPIYHPVLDWQMETIHLQIAVDEMSVHRSRTSTLSNLHLPRKALPLPFYHKTDRRQVDLR